MKKLLFVFVTLFGLALISGCGNHQNTVRYNGDNSSATSDKTGVDEKASPEADKAANDGETDTAATTTDQKEEKTKSPSAQTAPAVPTGKLAVTSFPGAYLKTKFSFNVVKGTVPSNTHNIKINNYQLSKYLPGQTRWDYIAATRFATLNSGLNTYVVKSYDAKGDENGSLIFSIYYDAPVVKAALPSVGSSLWVTLLTTLTATFLYAILNRKYRWL